MTVSGAAAGARGATAMDRGFVVAAQVRGALMIAPIGRR